MRQGGPKGEDAARPLGACINYTGQAKLGDEIQVVAVQGCGGDEFVTRRVGDGAVLAVTIWS